MSATEFGEALERQFAEVHQREMKRLERKLAVLGKPCIAPTAAGWRCSRVVVRPSRP
jgi:hypothetical protein